MTKQNALYLINRGDFIGVIKLRMGQCVVKTNYNYYKYLGFVVTPSGGNNHGSKIGQYCGLYPDI